MVELAAGAKIEKQVDFCYKAFHGTESHQSVVDLLLKGSGYYANAFERVDIEVNRAGNEDRASLGVVLELKEHFHCDPSSRYAVHDPGFTRAGISRQNDKGIAGRIIYDKALQVIANYKHALKHYKEYMDEDGNCPSGKGLEDMLLYVRQRMFVEFKGCRNKPTGAAGRNKAEVEEENMPVKWFFNGYFAFVLWGPKGLSLETISALSEDGRGVKKQSRADIRKEQALKNEAERQAGAGGHVPEVCRRGVSLTHKSTVAHIALREHNDHARTLRDIVTGLLTDSKQTMEECRLCCEQLKENRGNPSEEAVVVPWKKDLERSLVDIRKRRAEVENELREHLKKKPTQLDSLCDQVGDFGTVATATATTSSNCQTPRGRVVSVPYDRTDTSVLTEMQAQGTSKEPIAVDKDQDDSDDEDEEGGGYSSDSRADKRS